MQEAAKAMIEQDLVLCLERGAAAEKDVLAQLQQVLPADLYNNLPKAPAPRSSEPEMEAAAAAASPAGPQAVSHNGAITMNKPSTAAQTRAPAGTMRQAARGEMPTQDTRSAAALVELQSSVHDVKVCFSV